MANLFKTPKVEKGPTPPSPADERQRLAAQRALEQGGGRSSTIITSGLAAPLPRSPEVRAPKSVLTSSY